MTKAEKITNQIEFEYIEFTSKTHEEKLKELPITDKKSIKALIWNLLTDEKYRSQLSYKDYSDVLDIWLERL
jgi:hypothetical protein